MIVMDVNDKIPASDALLRQAIYIAFGGRCFYSGRDVTFAEMHVDHVRPRSKGGRDCIANYVLSCQDINLRKGDRHSEHFERVVLEVVGLIYAGEVIRVLADLRLNRGEFTRVNDWLRGRGIGERTALWHRMRHAAMRSDLPAIKRVLPGKSRGMVLYRKADLERLWQAVAAHGENVSG